ncbi:hypothetical protein DER44DRAFT_740834 [Fusarium oxysporum]|nr:hypothetical protein DER44DRAFT_740834 [Fusarium oxysporum]
MNHSDETSINTIRLLACILTVVDRQMPLLEATKGIQVLQFLEADVCRSLDFALFNKTGQLSNLHSELYNITDVYFGGPFIRGHPQTIQTLNISHNYYSKG